MARRTDDGFYIPMPFGPDTDWTRNVIAAGGASIRWKGRRYELTRSRDRGSGGRASCVRRLAVSRVQPVGIEHFLRLRDAR